MSRTKTFATLATLTATAAVLLVGSAQASCAQRKVTGTVIGGIGGALIGNSIARGGGGVIVGGLGGGLLGHEIAGSTCGHYRRVAYSRYSRDRHDGRYDSAYVQRDYGASSGRRLYYDQYGNPAAGQAMAAGYTPAAYSYATPTACRTEMRPYYDATGTLVERQVCVR